MKLRFHDNSIRLRLNRSELAQFSETGRVEDTIVFAADGSERLRFSLELAPELSEVRAGYDHGSIRIRVPRALARDWTETDRVGMEGEQPAGAARLRVLIEKDFRCLHRDGERDPEAFPNPLEASKDDSAR